MTEQLLEKAVDLNKKIKSMKEYKKELEEAYQKWWKNCTNNSPEYFSIRVVKNGMTTAVDISSDSAKIALIEEIKRTIESLTELQREFKEL